MATLKVRRIDRWKNSVGFNGIVVVCLSKPICDG